MNLASSFYTNVVEHKGKLLIRGVNNGQSYLSRINYNPKLYLPTRDQTKYKTLDGAYLKEKRFDSISKAKHFYSEYSTIPEYKIFGMNRYNYQYIADEYKGEVRWNKDYIKIFTLDIETECENGFPDPDTAKETIICITIKNHSNKQIITWGTGDFISKKSNVTYVKCQNEKHMLLEFLKFWCKNHPDILTGWNVKFFDMPYLMNRMRYIFDNDTINKMSPWNYVNADRIQLGNKSNQIWNILGLSVLDYFDLYKKFTYVRQESYKLNYIAKVELGEQKLDNPYETFKDFYTKDYQRFVEYNIQDVELVDRLEDKMKLIELCLTMAYDYKVNYTDVYSQVRCWDTIIYNHLLTKDIIIPPREDQVKDTQYEGAYVKDPQLGLHNWIVSFDLNSLYPHLIMQYNISPETFIGVEPKAVGVENFLDEKLNLKWATDRNVTIAPNGAMFKRDKQGFLPELMEKMYTERVVYKKKAIEAKIEYQKTKDPIYSNEISRCHNIQMAKKISLNSAYGAIGNQYFRYFDVKQAEAITLGGQLSIRWIERDVNKFMNKILSTDNINYVVASDTDSIYLKLDSLVQKVCKDKSTKQIVDFLDKAAEEKIQKVIDSSFENLAKYVNAYQQKMIMKREAIANKGIWVAKKRYMMNVFDEEGVKYDIPKLKIMGVEAVKSSTPEVCRGKIKDAIRVIMNDSEDSLIKFVNEFKEVFMTLSPEEVAFPRSCNNLGKYTNSSNIYNKGTPIHVKGSLIYNHNINKHKLQRKYPIIKDGDKIKFLMLKQPNTVKDTVISFATKIPEEFDLHKYVDYELQFEKTFTDPLRFILESIGWKLERQATLEAFFG
jgi:DNA polymerase elongation subunit (family B)|tara:strand:- start:16548 stop:19049 length:2502 start_codon:yes stop_codon:yes gene_type:complete